MGTLETGPTSKRLGDGGHGTLPIPETLIFPGETQPAVIRFVSLDHRPLEMTVHVRRTLLGFREVRLDDGEWPSEYDEWRTDVVAVLGRMRDFKADYDSMAKTPAAALTRDAPEDLYREIKKEVGEYECVSPSFLEPFEDARKHFIGRSALTRVTSFRHACGTLVGRLEQALEEFDTRGEK